MSHDIELLISDLLAYSTTYPQDIESRLMLAQLYDVTKQNEKAVNCYHHILEIDPYHAQAHFEIAVSAQLAKENQLALQHYQAIPPSSEFFITSLTNTILIYFKENQYINACHSAEMLVQSLPNDPKAWNDLGVIYKKLGQFDKAEAAFLKVLQLDSEHAQALGNLATIYRHQRQFYLAFEYAKMGLSRLPENAIRERVQQLNNFALICNDMHSFQMALMVCQDALHLDPENQVTHWNYSISLLLNQKWQEGFQEYVWGLTPLKARQELVEIWDKPEWTPHLVVYPEMCVAIYTEQGFGDTILFVRYVENILALGIKVVLVVQPELCRLLQVAFPDSPCISPTILGQYKDKITHQVCLLKLPALLHAETGLLKRNYLRVPALKFVPALKQLLDETKATGQKRVGLIWAGNPAHMRDQDRSVNFETFLPLIQAFMGQVHFFGLQKGEAQKEYSVHRHLLPHFHDVGSYLTDFAVTAAVMQELDLIISIDSAPAHLGSALGKQTWVLPPLYYPEWRWIIEKDTKNESIWYGDQVTVYQYPNIGDIRGCLAHLLEDLNVLIANDPI